MRTLLYIRDISRNTAVDRPKKIPHRGARFVILKPAPAASVWLAPNPIAQAISRNCISKDAAFDGILLVVPSKPWKIGVLGSRHHCDVAGVS